ncbi:MAG: tyrosine-type recombinase/integrase [Rubrivivax sp.]|jgi:integrase
MNAAKRTALPTGVFPKGRWYYRVRAEGAKRVWVKLSLIDDGLPAMYQALAAKLAEGLADDRMPAVIAAWQRDVMPRHAPKTQIDERSMCRQLSESFSEFRAGQVQAPDVAEYLAPLRVKPRTHNGHRSMLREIMRYSVERGFRTDNPVDHIKTMSTPARTRYITDSELRRIKVAGIRSEAGGFARSGHMLAALIDLAYLTGQRIGDLLELRWQRDPDDIDAPHVTPEGLRFRPSKTRKKTGAGVVIEWTPKLRDTVDRIKRLQAERLLKRKASQRVVSGYLITGQDGTPLTYDGAHSMWKRALKKSGVVGVHFHDLRAKALTDKEAAEGMPAARTMGTHSTEAQTADYVRSRGVKKTGATK